MKDICLACYSPPYLCTSSMNLYELIKKNNFQGFSIALIRRFAYSLLQCLKVLHKEKIIHCDLKPVSALFYLKYSVTYTIYICVYSTLVTSIMLVIYIFITYFLHKI